MKTALIIMAAMLVYWVQPAQAQPSEVLQAELLSSADSLAQGGTYPMAVRLSIAKGMHINSNQPGDPNLIPTRLELIAADSLSWGAPKFPPAHGIKLGFSDKKLLVFDGQVLVQADLKVGPRAKLGSHTISARISYQGCNNDMCMMPETQEVALTVEVVAAGKKGKPLHGDVFGR